MTSYEKRDGLFTQWKKMFEDSLAKNGKPAAILAFSMGNLVARTFLHWSMSFHYS